MNSDTLSRKDNNEDDVAVPQLYCYECGGHIDDPVKSKRCTTCGELYHWDPEPFGKICGFPTSESKECKSCMYKKHSAAYEKRTSGKKSVWSGPVGAIALCLFLAFAIFSGFEYLSGDRSMLFPFIMFAIGTVVTFTLFAISTSGTTA